MFPAVPPQAVTDHAMVPSLTQPMFTNNILTQLKPLQYDNTEQVSDVTSEPSELANILTGGHYILEKRPEPLDSSSETYFNNNNNKVGIKQSVIVQAPSYTERSPENAITSRIAQKQHNLKRKYQEHNNDSKSVPSNANFSKLQKLVPGLSEASIKISKAAQLMKAADQIKKLKKENENIQSEIDLLKSSNEELMKSITGFQNQLSFSGRSGKKILFETSKVIKF